MWFEPEQFEKDGRSFWIRTARQEDAGPLAELRAKMDGETEFLDREYGEGVLTKEEFEKIISASKASPNSLFLVAASEEGIVGVACCEGSPLRRLAHQVEFGICVEKAYWGIGIGKKLLERMLLWADQAGIHKISLKVLATNKRAYHLYGQYGFEEEGTLRDDKRLSDGRFYDTIVMGRINNR